MEVTFTTERTWARADEVVDYLRGPRLWVPKIDYPDFDDWIAKVHAQLKSEEKRAVLAFVGGVVAGAVVYQRHQTRSDTLEVKNLTVRPDVQGRFFASFLMRNAEVEGASDYGIRSVVVDAKARNLAIRAFLHKNGYQALGVEDLYGRGAGEDVVYSKRLRLGNPHRAV